MNNLSPSNSNKTTRRTFLKLAVGSSLYSVLPRSAGIAPALEWQTSGLEIPALSSFDNTMQEFMQARSIPAGSLAVTRNGNLVLARGYSTSASSSVKPDSLFRIASISKPFTSAAIMTLVQQKKLTLSQKLIDILDMKPANEAKQDARLKGITILNLLQHQGGWDRDASFDPMFYDSAIADSAKKEMPVTTADIIRYMSSQPLQFAPGTKYVYSNFGYCLLGRVIEAVSGQPYGKYVTDAVLTPLNIKQMQLGHSLQDQRATNEVPYFTSDPQCYQSVIDPKRWVLLPDGGFNLENMDSHGGWLASAVDLVRFASSFDGPAHSSVLSQQSIKDTFAISRKGMESGGWYYASGWAVRPVGNKKNTWHNGSLPGTTTLMVRRFDGLNWAVLFNQRDDPSGLSYDDIDGLLHQSADAVDTWPDHNLFDQF